MVAVAWNTSGFHALTILPNGTEFNASYYITEILQSIRERRNAQGQRGNRRLTFLAVHARPHITKSPIDFLEADGMKKTPHPPHSSHLAPSVF
jgi:hypothetical protein